MLFADLSCDVFLISKLYLQRKWGKGYSLNQQSIQKALRLDNIAGHLCVQTKGAQKSLPSWAEIKKLYIQRYSCRKETFSLPMQMLGADLQAHKVIYNNNPVLKWCLTNTGIQTDRNGNIVPIKNQSPKQRIDRRRCLNAMWGCMSIITNTRRRFKGAAA